MPNAQQNIFLEQCRAAMAAGTFKQAVFGLREAGKQRTRVKFELLTGGRKPLMRFTKRSGEERMSDFAPESAYMAMRSGDVGDFVSGVLNTEAFDFHYAENRKGEARTYRSKATLTGAAPSHNREKNYVLAKDRPYLHGLGVTTGDGAVVAKQYGKFRQIANFVEIIDRSIGSFVAGKDSPVTLLDLGCGKGYLTFAAYDYIRNRAHAEPHATGVDIKADMIALCNALAGDLGFGGLAFRTGRIEPDAAQKIDILIALHACDTATDDALALGVRSEMQFYFCAPCCQAEIAAQVKGGDGPFGIVNRYPLMKRRQADIITDACRALLLNAVGYDATFLEFTAIEHTQKNVMLTGRRSGSVNRKKAYADYLALKADYGFQSHTLEENLRGLLPDA